MKDLIDFLEYKPVRCNYVLKITWSWGLKEYKKFETKEEALSYSKKIEDDVEICILIPYEIEKYDMPAFDKTYSLDREWTDYEMDIYL